MRKHPIFTMEVFMVTIKLEEQEYFELQKAVNQNGNIPQIAGILQESYYGNGKRVLVEKDSFNKVAFDRHLADKKIREHNIMLDKIKTRISTSIEMGSELAYITISSGDLATAVDVRETIVKSGYEDSMVTLRKLKFLEKIRFSTEHPHILIVKF